jgi:hypothetical protein
MLYQVFKLAFKFVDRVIQNNSKIMKHYGAICKLASITHSRRNHMKSTKIVWRLQTYHNILPTRMLLQLITI